MSRHSRWVARLHRRVKDLGGWSMSIHGSAFGASGIPDTLVIINGNVAFIEVKVPPDTPSPIQKFVHRAIGRAGGAVHTCYGTDEIDEALDAMSRG